MALAIPGSGGDGTSGLSLAAKNPFIDFLAVNGDFGWGIEAEFDDVAFDTNDLHGDATVDDHALVCFSREH
jgi:hypothetical protein